MTRTKKEKKQRIASFVGILLGMTTWEMWKHFWVIPIWPLEVGIGVSLLTAGGVFIAFTILGDLQNVFLGRKYLFDFPPYLTDFLISYTVIIAGFDFLFALMTGKPPW